MSTDVSHEHSEPATEELSLTTQHHEPLSAERGRRTAPRIALGLALVAAAIAIAVTNPFSWGATGGSGDANSLDATGTYTISRQDLTSQTEQSATLGYAGTYNIALPAGTSTDTVTQAEQAVTVDQQTLSADEQTASDKASADNEAVASAQSDVAVATTTLSVDQVSEAQDCAGTAATSSTCASATQKVSADQTQLSQANQQLQTAESSATLDNDQDQAKVQADQTKLAADQTTLATEQAKEVDPGTTYTWLPKVGDVVDQDQPLYALDNEDVPLLYGSTPAYRAFYVGMSDGDDVGELTADLIALGFGGGLTPTNHYSAATATAVEHWQNALNLPATGTILLGAVVFEPGPIRVTSVTPSLGQSVGGAGSAGGSTGSNAEGGSGGGGVLSATSTMRQVSIALDASDQSQVAVGDRVSITLPNNATTPGVITSVGTVASSSSAGTGDSSSSSTGNSGSGSSGATITVLVNPTDPAATGSWDQAQVNVTITSAMATNALVVPVAALRAQPGGAYAVEVVGADSVHRLVPVSLGLFDDAQGLVQVTESTLAPGQRVVVPKL
jgi:multidrug efflux pump subunit AcrA (membrane-fusion protein)